MQREPLQPPLGLLAPRDVARDREHQQLAVDVAEARADLHRHIRAVAGAAHRLVDDALLDEEPLHDAAQLARRGRRVDGARREPEQFLARVAEEAAGGIVDGDEARRLAVGVKPVQVDGVVADLEEQTVAPLAGGQLTLERSTTSSALLQASALAPELLDAGPQGAAHHDEADDHGDVLVHAVAPSTKKEMEAIRVSHSAASRPGRRPPK